MSSTPIDESRIRKAVKDVISRRGTDWIPDAVEEALYTNAILVLMNLADEFLNQVSVRFMGHEIKMDIQKCEDASDADSECHESCDGMRLRSGRVLKSSSQ